MKTISKKNYYALLGIAELARQNSKRFEELVECAGLLTNSTKDQHGYYEGGRVEDFVYEREPNVDGLLRTLDIEVAA